MPFFPLDLPPRSLVEVDMMRFACSFRNKKGWDKKVMDESIRGRWEEEGKEKGLSSEQLSYVMQVSYMREKTKREPGWMEGNEILTPPSLLLVCILPCHRRVEADASSHEGGV